VWYYSNAATRYCNRSIFSQRTSHSQTKYSAYDRELLAIYEAIKHFRYMLERQNFYWSQITNLSFIHLRGNQIRCRHTRHLIEFITDVTGAENIIANLSVSRVDIIVMPTSLHMQEIVETQFTDEELQQLKQSTSWKLKKFILSKTASIIYCDTSEEESRPYIFRCHYEDEFSTWYIKCLIPVVEQLIDKSLRSSCGLP